MKSFLTNVTDQQPLKCVDCISQNGCSKSIPLISLLDSDNTTIFKSWPILDDSIIYSQLHDMANRTKTEEESITKLKIQFKDLKAHLIESLEKKEQEMCQSIYEKIKSFEQVIEVYNEISQKNKLKEIILNQYQNFSQQNLILKKIIAQNLQNQDIMKTKILEQIQNTNLSS
ncbi:hypothetical protein ABPG72_017791 [Tetrahymena utriculariae]